MTICEGNDNLKLKRGNGNGYSSEDIRHTCYDEMCEKAPSFREYM